MLHLQLIIVHKERYTGKWFEPQTFCTESKYSTTELLRQVIHMPLCQLYLRATAFKEALIKRLFSAAFHNYIIKLFLQIAVIVSVVCD